MRQGEASLDRFYRPFHTVVYYRYLRFFSNGKHTLSANTLLMTSTPTGRVLYLTSPEDPASCVSKIKGYGDHQSLLGGHYTISDNDEDRRVSVYVDSLIVEELKLEIFKLNSIDLLKVSWKALNNNTVFDRTCNNGGLQTALM